MAKQMDVWARQRLAQDLRHVTADDKTLHLWRLVLDARHDLINQRAASAFGACAKLPTKAMPDRWANDVRTGSTGMLQCTTRTLSAAAMLGSSISRAASSAEWVMTQSAESAALSSWIATVCA